jgi:hypothetical protein
VTCHCTHIALAHQYRASTAANDGECLAPQCVCGGYESGEKSLGIRGKSTSTWENVASPQGALTPAGSDHLPLTTNERG